MQLQNVNADSCLSDLSNGPVMMPYIYIVCRHCSILRIISYFNRETDNELLEVTVAYTSYLSDFAWNLKDI